jgi:PAS domain S-box-containing protein
MSKNRYTILLIDDNLEDRATYRHYLERNSHCNYIILEAGFGEEGLELCKRTNPDAVFLDYLLPDLDGLEFLAQLREQTNENYPAVIMMTGQGDELIAVQAIKAGAQDYLVKGRLTSESVRLALESAIEKAQLRAKLQQSEERLKLALQAARMGTWEWNIPLDRIVWSDLADSIFDRSPELHLSSYQAFVDAVHPDDREYITQSIARALKEGTEYDVEFRTIWLDGSAHWVSSKGKVYYDKVGQPLRMLGTVMDITHSKQAEIARQQENYREKLVLQIAHRIGKSLDLDEILNTTVQEVRQFLQSDRVLIFSFDSHWEGKVVVESANPDFTPILSTSIYDPCFTQNWIEPYRNGRILAIEDIYTANLMQCHVELLSQFQIRANLVVPILQGEHLWGLLIAHQCSAPRQWQQWEIDLLSSLTTQIGIAIQQSTLYKQTQVELVQRRQAEESLQAINQRLSDILTSITDAFYTLDSEWRFTYLNPKAAQFLQRNQDDLIGKNLWEEFPDKVNMLFYQEYHRAVSEQVSVHFEEFYSLNNSWYEVRAYPTRDGLAVYFQDISSRKQAESELRYALGRLNFLIGNSPLAVVEWDDDFRICRWSSESERVFGWKAEEVIGKQFGNWKFVFEEDLEIVTATVTRLREGVEQRNICHNRNYAKDGSVVYCEWYNSVVADESGKMISVLSLLIDVTERKRIEAALTESEALFRNMADSSPVMLWLCDVNKQCYYFNKPWLDFTGRTMAEEIGDGWTELVHPDDLSYCLEIYMHAFDARQEFRMEYRLKRRDGEYRWLLDIGTPRFTSVGDFLGYIGSCIDISDRKQVEIERTQLLEREQAANRIKNEFLAVLSHELRTPLNPILGWIKILQKSKLDPAKTSIALATIERNAKLQAQLIEDLLDVSQILQGKLTLNVSLVNLENTIAAALETIRLAAQAKSIQIQSVFEAHRPNVIGDSSRLQQVVWNLLSNAVKFTPSNGKVEVRLQCVDDYAQITVSDTGLGISAEFLPYVFDYFRQANSSTTRSFGGLGLGLAIVRQLVELHGGIITAHSIGKGQGATFIVKLPLLRDEEPING